jgi:putative spermidine/putrescine transport system ATP-binding protein
MGITTIYVTHDQEEALSLSDRIVVMSQGHMEQVGTPSEIYNHPTTEFVASFVGQLNLLPVSDVDFQNGTCKLGGHLVRFDHSERRQISAKPRLAIRPEEFQFGQAEGRNVVLGRVEVVMFLGAVVRLRVRMGEALVSVDLFNERNMTIPRVGDDVTISFPAHACWIM